MGALKVWNGTAYEELVIAGNTSAASNVTFAPTGTVEATTVQAAIAEVSNDVTAHLADTDDAHDASAVSVLDAGGYFTGTNVETVLAELPGLYGHVSGAGVGERSPHRYATVNYIDVVQPEICTSVYTLTTQRIHFVHFTVGRKMTVNTMVTGTDAANVSTTTNVARLGLWCRSVEDGEYWPLARSASDTTMFKTTWGEYVKAFSTTGGWPAAVTLVPGRQYAAAIYVDWTGGTVGVSSSAACRTLLTNWSRSRLSGSTAPDFPGKVSGTDTAATQIPWIQLREGGTENVARTCVLLGDSFLASYDDWAGYGNAQGGARFHYLSNAGVGSETLAQIAARWTADVAPLKPEWVLLHGGVNDIGANASAATIQTRYETIIALAQAAGYKLLICTPPPPSGTDPAQLAVLASVRTYLLALSATGVTVVDTGIAMTTGDGVTADAAKRVDTVHPNAAGITALAAALAPAVLGVT